MQMRDFRLDEHVAIVTGAGRGIGAGIAMAYAQAGADVVLVARTRQQLDAVAARIRTTGRTAITVAYDVRDLTQAPIVVERAVAELGRLDVVVNNAGGAEPRALLDTTGAELDAAFHLNVTAAFELVKQATPQLLEGGHGSVVNISSTMDRMAPAAGLWNGQGRPVAHDPPAGRGPRATGAGQRDRHGCGSTRSRRAWSRPTVSRPRSPRRSVPR
jgi:7-alpha-hydroxysteroid dehydrogenase